MRTLENFMKITQSQTQVSSCGYHTQYKAGDKSTHPDFKDIMADPANQAKYPSVFKYRKPEHNLWTPSPCYGGLPDMDYQTCQVSVIQWVDLAQCVVGALDPDVVAGQLEKMQKEKLDHAQLESTMTEVPEPVKEPLGRFYQSVDFRFYAKGKVETEDGRTIEFKFAMHHVREDYKVHRFPGKDPVGDSNPLIIDTNNKAPERGKAQIEFDMDGDGTRNRMTLLKPGSGFLALDKNEDGKINDGSELFGAQSGTNGFEQLKAYDEDGNGWIDENDSVYDKLQIWESDAEGKMQLKKLKDLGIGAIYLQFSPNPMDLWAEQDYAAPAIRYSSCALNETGNVHAVHALNWLS